MTSEAEAVRLAEVLVGERLAACVQWRELTSCYRWQGVIEWASEVRLEIKTALACMEVAVARVRALHPYELPEIMILEARASDEYTAWIAAETRSEE